MPCGEITPNLRKLLFFTTRMMFRVAGATFFRRDGTLVAVAVILKEVVTKFHVANLR
jgi:hypothetical protein